MPAPSDLIKLDLAFGGQPFVQVAIGGAIPPGGLDVAFGGQPFTFAAEIVGTVATAQGRHSVAATGAGSQAGTVVTAQSRQSAAAVGGVTQSAIALTAQGSQSTSATGSVSGAGTATFIGVEAHVSLGTVTAIGRRPTQIPSFAGGYSWATREPRAAIARFRGVTATAEIGRVRASTPATFRGVTARVAIGEVRGSGGATAFANAIRPFTAQVIQLRRKTDVADEIRDEEDEIFLLMRY